MKESIIKVENLHKTYRLGKQRLEVLRGVSFAVQPGEFVSIVGASGSGKSTLLHIAGVLDKSDKGKVFLEGKDVSRIGNFRRNKMRCRDIGFVFQFYHLFGELSVLDNVLLAARVLNGGLVWFGSRSKAVKRAKELLERMGLENRLKHLPRELSGGERQRVALARALMNKPKVLMADEPTGNLDSKTGGKIIELLEELNKAGQTILMVTHDNELANRTHRIMHLADGKLVHAKKH